MRYKQTKFGAFVAGTPARAELPGPHTSRKGTFFSSLLD